MRSDDEIPNKILGFVKCLPHPKCHHLLRIRQWQLGMRCSLLHATRLKIYIKNTAIDTTRSRR